MAIVGPTGSGKTTLINLLMQAFYDINSGKLASMDIRLATSRRSSRNGFGMVLQETWLQNGNCP